MLKVVHGFVDSKRMICFCMACAMLSVALISFGAHATNPQSVDYNVYIKPSLNVSVSSNSVVLNINPAGSLNGSNNPNNFASNNLNVSVATNNQYGYKLYLATENNTTDLVRNQDPENTGTDDGISGTIPTLDTTTTESDFPYNKWGYKQDSETNYKPFQSNTLISSSTIATNEQTSQLTFGAKANYDKPAGQYELDLNFKALPTVTTYYMQDIAKDSTLAESVCTEEPTVVIDKRDEKAYTIRRIGGDATHPGDCWMVENLQFTGTSSDAEGTMTLNPITSNVATDTTLTYYDLITEGGNDGKCHGATSSGTGYNNACLKEGTIASSGSPISSGSSTQVDIPTVWYNYFAASAGTISDPIDANPQIYDICPSGWRLPNHTEIVNINSSISNFNPVIGGLLYNANPTWTEYGFWWSSNVYNTDAHYRYAISYTNGIASNSGYYRYHGMYVRCVMKDTNINNLTYMQDFARVTESDTATGDNKKQQIIDSMELNSTTGYTLKDIRDNQEYTINKIGPEDDASEQNIWMTKNLAIGCNGSSISQIYLDNSNTNITSSSWRTPSALLSAASAATETADYSNPRMQCNQTYGAWYNYAATTAGTIINASNVTPATKDICPAGWNIPSSAIAELITGSSYAPVFNFSISGGYIDGSINNTRVWWWTSSPTNDSSSAITRSTLKTASNTSLWTDSDGYRFRGFHIRCVVK